MKILLRIVIIAFLFLAAAVALLAQNTSPQSSSPQNNSPQVQNVTVILTDKSGRLFQSGTLDATLISAPGFESGQTIGTEEVQFNVGDGSKTYPIHEGRAETRLLVQNDPAKEPFKYQFSGKAPDSTRFVSKSIDVSSTTRTITLVAPDKLAPHSSEEKTSGIIFGLVALLLIFLTFFYWGFRRMLFNRRMEVPNAVFSSTVITLLYVLFAAGTVLVAFWSPGLMNRAINTYLGLLAIFLALYLFGLTLMLLFTRSRVLRG